MVAGGSNLFEGSVISSLHIPGNGRTENVLAVLGPSASLCVVSVDLVQTIPLSVSQSCQPVVFKLECPVDAVGWSESETLLVLGDRQGVLHFVSSSLQQVLFSQNVGVNAKMDGGQVFASICFSHSKESELSTLYVLCHIGVVLVFGNLPLNQLRKALETNNMQILQQGCGSSGLCVWGRKEMEGLELYDGISYLLKGICLVRAQLTLDGGSLVTLTDTLKLVLATLPKLHTFYFQEVSPTAALVQGTSNQDSLYYTEVEEGGLVVRHLVQALPEQRLATLLAQGLFDQAEKLAEKFSLDPELVYKMKARVLNNQLISCVHTGEEMAGLQADFLQCLSCVQDAVFVAELVLPSCYPTFGLILDTLLLAKKKLRKAINVPVKSSQLKVFSALNKIVTFQMLHSQTELSSKHWHSFLSQSVLDLLSSYSCTGDLRNLSIIWSRHMGELVTQLSGNNLLVWLRKLPDLVPSTKLGPWLSRNVVPFMLQHSPQSLPWFLDWAQERVRSLELSEKEHWPMNGLQLCECIVDAVSSFRNPLNKMVLQSSSLTLKDISNTDKGSLLSSLTELQQRLRDLCYLQSTLQCAISLAEHEKESREVVVYRLLDQAIAAELVSTTIQHKVAPYVQRHALCLDSVLLSYIKLFLSQSPRLSSDSRYEAKAIALVTAVKDKELYVSGCIEVLKHVHTPWSAAVEELVQHCLGVEHPHVAMLEKQYQLLQLKKLLHGYGIKNVNFSDMTSSYRWLYIRRILSTDGPAVLEDALKIASMYHLSPTEVYKIHVYNLGMRGETIAASDALKALTVEEQLATAASVFERTSTRLRLSFQHGLDDPEEYVSSARLALLCLTTLRQAGADNVLSEDWINIDSIIDLHERLLSLQTEYSLFLSADSLADRETCLKLFQEKVTEFAEAHCGSEQKTNTKHFHNGSRFASLLGFSQSQFSEAVATECARNMNIKQARDICWDLVHAEPNSYPPALLLYTVQQAWAAIASDPDSVTERDVKELRALAAQAVARADKGLLLSAVEVYSICVLLCVLYPQCEGVGPDLMMNQEASDCVDFKSGGPVCFREDGLVLSQQEVLPAAMQCAGVRVSPLFVNKRLCVRHTPTAFSGDVDEVQTLSNLSSKLSQTLQDNGHLQLSILCSMQALSLFYQQTGAVGLVEKGTVLNEEQKVMSSLLSGLTAKVLSFRKLDHDYGLSLLLMLPPEVATQKLHGIRYKSISSYSRVISLCNLALDYSDITGQTQLHKLAHSFRNSAEWGRRLGKLKVSFTEAFRGGSEERKKVTATLFRSKLVDIDTILQYTNDVLGNSDQSVLLAYLKVVLSEWEEPRVWLERAETVLSLITSHKHAQDLLATLLRTKVSPYNYERISFILQNLANGEQAASLKVEQGLLLVECLKCYSRKSPPAELERNWYISHYLQPSNSDEPFLSDVQLPSQSVERLPFHCLLYGTAMDIIGPELSGSTISKLIPIARILMLDEDNFYSVAIKNIATSSCDNHVISSPSKIQFGSLTDLLVRIKNMNLALSITKWLAKKLQDDEERVAALKTAVSIAHKWKDQAHTESDLGLANERLRMFTNLLRITQTDQLLHQYGLADLKDLSNQGALLIIKLFTDIPVSKRQPLPDVHILATDIARVHNISLDKIKTKLTEMWLTTSSAESKDMDVTQMSLMEDPTEDREEGDSEDDRNLKRLKYLLSVPNKLEDNASMLLHWAKRITSSSAGNLSRVKALQVLFAIATDQLIERISGAPLDDIREYMQCALFASELERLHMTTSVAAFQACNKEGLVKSLWRNHSQEPRALRLIGELCLHYAIKNSNLWSKLLQALFNLGMLVYLRHLLKVLSARPEYLWDIQVLPSLWQDVLLLPFQDASPPLSPFHQEECTESLKMLIRCPFVFELDIPRITREFHNVGLLYHALVTTLSQPKELDRQTAVKCILEKLDPESLQKFLDGMSSGPAVVSGFLPQVEELVYLYVNSSGRHNYLLGSKHFTSYVYFLVTRKMINGLLIKTLEAKMISEAVQLVSLYNQHYNVSTLSGLELLKEYIKESNLSEYVTYNL